MRWMFLLLILISGCINNITGMVVNGNTDSYIVVNVVDGDTLDLNNTERVRLSGINTPEKGECYYLEAKNKLIDLTLNKEVRIESDKDNIDKYGRLLRYVYVGDLHVNKYLVEQGYAKVYDKYKDSTAKYDQLKNVEQSAVSNQLGVWSCEKVGKGCLYVGSKNSDLYHTPNCKYALRISPENLVCYHEVPIDKKFSGC